MICLLSKETFVLLHFYGKMWVFGSVRFVATFSIVDFVIGLRAFSVCIRDLSLNTHHFQYDLCDSMFRLIAFQRKSAQWPNSLGSSAKSMANCYAFLYVACSSASISFFLLSRVILCVVWDHFTSRFLALVDIKKEEFRRILHESLHNDWTARNRHNNRARFLGRISHQLNKTLSLSLSLSLVSIKLVWLFVR